MGLRLFPNPAFDEAAARRWDPERYYTDPGYYNDKSLVRPYRVGMSCGLCHVGPNPINPPADPNNPAWANLSSNVGAQYFWTDRIFYEAADYASFAFQLFHTSRPGSLDTSLVSTDYINNPRTMNAVYGLLPRLLTPSAGARRHWPVAASTTSSSTTTSPTGRSPRSSRRLPPCGRLAYSRTARTRWGRLAR